MTQYLILHKVRGEPAFDVAEKCQIGDEEGWVVSTSGHRAYPYRHWPLAATREEAAWQLFLEATIPEDWPDHYTVIEPPAKKGHGIQLDIGRILAGLVPKIKRRI